MGQVVTPLPGWDPDRQQKASEVALTGCRMSLQCPPVPPISRGSPQHPQPPISPQPLSRRELSSAVTHEATYELALQCLPSPSARSCVTSHGCGQPICPLCL